jgi:hypothetical protein
MQSVWHCCAIVPTLGAYGQIFLKASNNKFHENSSFDSRADSADVHKNEEPYIS